AKNEDIGAQGHGRAALVSRELSLQELHIIVLDQRIGEQAVGRLLERGLRLLAVAAVELYVEHLALADAYHAGNAEGFERTLDRLALRIEHARFERHGDTGLHGKL